MIGKKHIGFPRFDMSNVNTARIFKIRCPKCDSDDLKPELNPKRNEPDWTWFGNSTNGLRCQKCNHWFGVDP